MRNKNDTRTLSVLYTVLTQDPEIFAAVDTCPTAIPLPRGYLRLGSSVFTHEALLVYLSRLSEPQREAFVDAVYDHTFGSAAEKHVAREQIAIYLGALAQDCGRESQVLFQSGQEARPPRAGKFLLLLLPAKYREFLIGDLEEKFITVLVPEYGVRVARLWYWWHVLISLAPLMWAVVKRVATASFLWKLTR